MTSTRWIKRSNIAVVIPGSPIISPHSLGLLLEVKIIEVLSCIWHLKNASNGNKYLCFFPNFDVGYWWLEWSLYGCNSSLKGS